jgi:hypothetical protein
MLGAGHTLALLPLQVGLGGLEVPTGGWLGFRGLGYRWLGFSAQLLGAGCTALSR